FQPAQGTVYLTPPPPSACSDAGSCPSGQLCFAGVCNSGCPENNFPPYGNNGYVVYIGTPSGPFFLQSSSTTSTVSSGTGSLTSFSFSGGTTTLSFSNDAGFMGRVSYTLPQVGANCCLEAFHPPETLSIAVT